MTRYRFLDGMGDVVAEEEFDRHADALAWANSGGTAGDGDGAEGDEGDERLEDVQRVEFLGPEGDWRWAGALGG